MCRQLLRMGLAHCFQLAVVLLLESTEVLALSVGRCSTSGRIRARTTSQRRELRILLQMLDGLRIVARELLDDRRVLVAQGLALRGVVRLLGKMVMLSRFALSAPR